MSDIENDFYKLALERGLISEAEEKEKKSEPKLTSSDILYGKFPKEDVLEQAHPKPIVLFDAYDQINGLVEDLDERQALMIDSANRTPKGNFEFAFFAQAYSNLMNETVKIAFELDKDKNYSLMNLADNCSLQLKKQAGWPLILGIIGIVGSLLYGGLYLSNNPSSQGIKNDTSLALEKIQKISEENSSAGATLNSLKESLTKLASFIDQFHKYNDEIVSALLNVGSAITPEEKKQSIAANAKQLLDGPEHDQIIKTYNAFKQICEIVSGLIPTVQEYLIKEKDLSAEQESSFMHTVKKFVKDYLWSSNYDDLIKILSNLKDDLSKIPKSIDDQISKLNELKSKTESISMDEILKPEAK